MADQNLNVNLSIDSAQYVQGVSKAASKTESIGAAANGAADSLASMEQVAVADTINITRAGNNIAIAMRQIQGNAVWGQSFVDKRVHGGGTVGGDSPSC